MRLKRGADSAASGEGDNDVQRHWHTRHTGTDAARNTTRNTACHAGWEAP